jgi:magnesium transporter
MVKDSGRSLLHDQEDTLSETVVSEEGALYGVSREFERQVLDALDENDVSRLEALIRPYHAADIADFIQMLRPDDRRRFITATKTFLNPDILVELDDPIREEVLEALDTRDIAAAATDLDTDDALELIEDLDDEQQREVLRALPAGERAILEEGLTYPADSAGRMMQHEVVCVPPFWTVKETITFIREMEDMDMDYYDIYVVDPKHHPIGEIPLGKLLRSAPHKPVSEIMSVDLHPIPVTTDQEEVALTFQHYALVSAPVVDPTGRMVGMITVDDVVHVIKEEAEEDIMHLANVKESDLHAPIVTTAYWRMRWLFVTLLTSLLASLVISQFQDAIQKVTALAFLMPIAAALGGSAGMQVVTIIVRALATRTLRKGDTWRAVGKEVSVSLLVGTFFALSAGMVVAFWMHDLALSVVLFLGIFLNMLWAAFGGTLVPIFLDYLDLDPAVSAGPILMTTTDILGFAIFLGLATLLLL